jgi:hypothetical protein
MLRSVLFPGRIEPSETRSVGTIMDDSIDAETGALKISDQVRIPPTELAPHSKLVFRKVVDPASGGVSYTYIGTTRSETQFTQMADFIYTPPNQETHIHGGCVSKQSVPNTSYNYEGNPYAREGGVGEMDESSTVAFLRFRDEADAPQGPTARMQTIEVDPDLVQAVNELFAVRPIWQRVSLEEALGEKLANISYWRFSHAIRMNAYLFLDGPWRNCYVRFGFDPRVDPGARSMQMIDFRDPYFLREKPEKSDEPTDIHFRRPPAKMSQLYQLNDIDDPTISALISKPAHVSSPDPHTGWLSEFELTSIRNQMKLKAEAMRRTWKP